MMRIMLIVKEDENNEVYDALNEGDDAVEDDDAVEGDDARASCTAENSASTRNDRSPESIN
jgi:hypothetical protein